MVDGEEWMAGEQQAAIDALKQALQMELEGKEFYARAASQSGNELGRQLLASLAAEEDIHRQVFTKIYEEMRTRNAWPAVSFQPDGGQQLRTVFAQALERVGAKLWSVATELETVRIARQMETRTYDFYQARRQVAGGPLEKDFYEKLAAQEQEHGLVLADYAEYLQDPAAWFVKKEHPLLD